MSVLWRNWQKFQWKSLSPLSLCLSQISVQEGKPFLLPLPCPSFLLPQPWQKRWQECKWRGLCFETFSELHHLLLQGLFLCTKVYPWHCFQNGILDSAVESQPFELLGQSFPSRTVTLFWSHFDCSGAFWGPLETAFSWLEPFPPLAAGTENRYGWWVRSKMHCPLLSCMALHGGSWCGSARLVWQFSPVYKAEWRLQPEEFFWEERGSLRAVR